MSRSGSAPARIGRREHCQLCGTDGGSSVRFPVQSNVRCFSQDRFPVWRCPGCSSIHSLDRVPLDPYYASYPIHERELSRAGRLVFRRYLRRIRRHGIGPQTRILDYGCGSGQLLDYLREQGYDRVHGYDPYMEQWSDPGVLRQRYGLVLAQDVLEHVEDPQQLLNRLHDLLQPGGLLVIGTPRAESICLRRAGEFVHSLHQPYHLHILSEKQLRAMLTGLGHQLLSVSRRHLYDTWWPMLNWNFLTALARRRDNTLDAFFEPAPPGWFLSPGLWLRALFGYLRPCPGEMLLISRKPPDKETV